MKAVLFKDHLSELKARGITQAKVARDNNATTTLVWKWKTAGWVLIDGQLYKPMRKLNTGD